MVLYSCTGCKYESDRLYNVIRHEQRIHCNKRLRVCCGKKLYTKGDYYKHCAVHHPWRRARAITSERKYKIRAGTGLITSAKDRGSTTLSRDFHRSKRSRRRCEPGRPDSSYQFETRSSERRRGRPRRERRFGGKTVEEKRRGRHNTEDVPLIKLVNAARRGARFKKCGPGRVAGWKKENDPAGETAGRNIEGAASRNDGHLVQEQARSSTSVFSPLPLKKLLLHRFGGNVGRGTGERGFREQNNNDRNQRDYEGKRMETVEEEPQWSQRRNNKWHRVTDKENASPGPQFMEQTVNVKFDDEFSGRRVTEMHRDFLSLIDFDTYRIF